MELKTKLAGIPLANCIYNASGSWCMTQEELDGIKNSKAAAVICKSTTKSKREGNPLPRYYEMPGGSINSMGLPNLGLNFYLEYFEQNHSEKPIFLSVAGLTLEENIEILKGIQKQPKAPVVELNLSCPNVPGKPQTAYDFERTEVVLNRVFEFYDQPLGIKLPPYFDIVHFEQMARILLKFPIQFVTCINSIGNGLWIDPDKETVVIKPKGGFGGLGGDFVKPTALANVRKFYELIGHKIDIVGCGGIKSGMDIFEHILCGATAVQVGTQLMKEGPEIFDRLNNELKKILEQKGYQSLEDFRGKLKRLS